jgi:hypothetical protein
LPGSARLVHGVAARGDTLALLAVGGSTATADPTVGPPICTSAGTALSGSYHNLRISGNAYVAGDATLSVEGNLTLARGACLDAFSMGTVTVRGNIIVGEGATLALGCTLASLEPGEETPCTGTTNDTVGGNIIANQPLTMYLDGDHVHGNVISVGGGDPSLTNPFLSFPIKDNQIDGNVIVHGWKGAWFGVIRNVVGGNVIVSHTVGTRTSEPPQDPTHLDSTEVQTNTIAGNLICVGNTPPAQVNPDDGGQPNIVGGNAVGECKGLTG